MNVNFLKVVREVCEKLVFVMVDLIELVVVIEDVNK